MSRLQIAEELLGTSLEDGGGGQYFGRCPGQSHHTHRNGRKDFRIILEGAPTGYCVHTSCSGEVGDFNLQLRRAIGRAERTSGSASIDTYNREVAPLPREERRKKRPPLSRKMVERIRSQCRIEGLSEEWLRSISPIDVSPGAWTYDQFFGALYKEGERVLVFSSSFSQGDFLWWVGHGSYRLGSRPGVSAVRSKLPRGGRDGVWFLTNPVTGKWERKRHLGKDGSPELSRRSETAVTAWRYLVLESDDLSTEDWLSVVVQLPVPIAAIYTSGGKSVHVLVRMAAVAKADFDATRDAIEKAVCPVGADPAAMSAVRLSRLPGMLRGARRQELLYLDPSPDGAELQYRKPLVR